MIEHYLEIEIDVTLDLNDVAGTSVYVGAKHLMAYAQLCLVAAEIGRWERSPVTVTATECLSKVGFPMNEMANHRSRGSSCLEERV